MPSFLRDSVGKTRPNLFSLFLFFFSKTTGWCKTGGLVAVDVIPVPKRPADANLLTIFAFMAELYPDVTCEKKKSYQNI